MPIRRPPVQQVSFPFSPVLENDGVVLKTAAFVPAPGGQYAVDTTTAAITATLPASPALRDRFFFEDPQGTWAGHNFTIARNGNLIGGAASDLVCDQSNASLEFEYVGGAMGWQVFRNS